MLSVIIPTYNEEAQLAGTIAWLKQNSGLLPVTEIIVADGGSTDNTADIALKAGARLLHCTKKGRAQQMNEAAKKALGQTLYFLHADTTPPADFQLDIQKAVENGFGAGCYRLQFDLDHWFLKANCWFTRFDVNAFRFGDQSLFVSRNVFFEAGGFSEKHIVLEDQDLVKRIKKLTRFTVLQKPVITSARKYSVNGIYKTQGIFFLIYLLYTLGVPQKKLVSVYRTFIRQDKL